MTATLFTGIAELVTNDPERDDLLGIHEQAALVVEGADVAWVGPAAEAPAADAAYDLAGRAVLPGLRRQPQPPGLRRGPARRSSPARMAGEPYAARRDPDDGRRDPRRHRRASSPPTSRDWSRRCARRARRPWRSRAATG